MSWGPGEGHLHLHWTQHPGEHLFAPESQSWRLRQLRKCLQPEKWGGSGRGQEQHVPAGICSLMSLQCFRVCLASYKQKQNNERKEYQQAPAQAARRGSLRCCARWQGGSRPVSYSPASRHSAVTLRALQGEKNLMGLWLSSFLSNFFFSFLIAKRKAGS